MEIAKNKSDGPTPGAEEEAKSILEASSLTDPAEPAAYEPEPTLTRRSLFTRLFEGAVCATPIINGFVPDPALASSALAENSFGPVYPFTDETFPLPGGGELRNIGALHTTSEFRRWNEHLIRAVKDTDILLLERGDGYFAMLEGAATAHDKAVYEVDKRNEAAVSVGMMSTTLLPIIATMKALRDKPVGYSRRVANVLMALVPATFIFPKMQTLLRKIVGPAEQDGRFVPPADIAYITDGRTVNMLANSLAIAQQNPGKKLLLISGDAHAEAINTYLGSKQGLESFERRRSIYQQTYNRLFGEGREQLHDPS